MAMLPRTVDGVLDFIDKFETIIDTWPKDVKWPLTYLAQVTKTELPYVVEYIEEILNRPLDIHEPLPHKDGERALMLLKQRMRTEIEGRRKRRERQKLQALHGYDKIMEKVRTLQAERNWYGAYRTLTYFMGTHGEQLNPETKVSICNDCLRIGIKANVNFQELALWLKKGIEETLQTGSMDAIEDALDFVDAYGEYFIHESTGKGIKFIAGVIQQLLPTAMEAGLSSKLQQISVELNLPAPSLVL